jgi:amidohydrolase
MVDKIKLLSQDIFTELVKIRRHLHSHPELSFKEYETSAYIKSLLDHYDIPYTDGWVETGIVAQVQGRSDGNKVIALRADIDALPITEENEVSYISVNQGIMHACGHDVHTTSLFGACIILNQLKDDWGGIVKFIFQPGEEKLPGGAKLMIDHGVLDDPRPYCIFGQHVHPPLEVGKVGIRAGQYMASADEIYINISGKGGHAALPQELVDPVLIASHVIVALQQLVSRKSNPFIPSVLSFGKINSIGGATNIIPNKVTIEGTFRTMDEEWRDRAHTLIEKLATELAHSMGGVADVNIIKGYPYLKNDELLTNITKKKMIEYMGAENVVELPKRMSAEDFAYYTHHIPGCFYRLGTGNKSKGITSSVHTPTFDIDEDALKVGAGLMAFLAISALKD